MKHIAFADDIFFLYDFRVLMIFFPARIAVRRQKIEKIDFEIHRNLSKKMAYRRKRTYRKKGTYRKKKGYVSKKIKRYVKKAIDAKIEDKMYMSDLVGAQTGDQALILTPSTSTLPQYFSLLPSIA